MTYDEDKLIPATRPSGKIEPISAVCVGGPTHGAMMHFYPSSPYTGQPIASMHTNGQYDYVPESEEYAAHFMWRDY